MHKNNTTDKLHRPIQDLRISVIDRCNFRCTYCMPEEKYSEHYDFLKKEEWLSFPEILRLVGIFMKLGVKKARLTGGEPLLRPGLPELIRELSKLSGLEDLALTTNGALLSDHVYELKASGLKRLTISLDTLDSRVFRLMNGKKGSLQQILDGIKKAGEAGFNPIKINVVLQKGVNDNTILDMVRYFKGTGHVLRFIEYMDVGNSNDWQYKYVVPSEKIVELIDQHFPLAPASSNYFGEVASRYRFKDGSGEIGLVSSVTQPFCRDCTRARLSADGKLYTCLFAADYTDIKYFMKNGYSDQQLSELIRKVWAKREDRYSELRSGATDQKQKKVEMFQIGG